MTMGKDIHLRGLEMLKRILAIILTLALFVPNTSVFASKIAVSDYGNSWDYDNVEAEVNQIKNFISRGLYLEAIKVCEETLAWHELSQSDKTLLAELKWSAQESYNKYVESLKNGTQSGSSTPSTATVNSSDIYGVWSNCEDENDVVSLTHEITVIFNTDNTFYSETWRVKEYGTYTIKQDKIIVNYEMYFCGAGSTEYVYDSKGTYTFTFKNGSLISDSRTYKKIKSYTAQVVYYDNVLSQVDQIKAYIKKGLYLEAIDLCNSTEKTYNLSPDDISIINNLKITAVSEYDSYLNTPSYYDATNEINQINNLISRGLFLEAEQVCKETLAWHKLSEEDVQEIESLEQGAIWGYIAYTRGCSSEGCFYMACAGYAAYENTYFGIVVFNEALKSTTLTSRDREVMELYRSVFWSWVLE